MTNDDLKYRISLLKEVLELEEDTGTSRLTNDDLEHRINLLKEVEDLESA